MKNSGFGSTDVGLCRSNNEDSFLADDAAGLYVVCDGMGGHAAGEVASAEAVRAVHEFLELLRDAKQRQSLDDLVQLIKEAVNFASSSVLEIAERTAQPGMGTTLTLLLVAGHRGIAASWPTLATRARISCVAVRSRKSPTIIRMPNYSRPME